MDFDTVTSIKVEIPLTPNQHEFLMSLVNKGIAADMDVYFEEGKFYADISDPRKNVIHEIEPKIVPAKEWKD